MFGGIELDAMFDAGGAEPALDDVASLAQDVGIVGTEDHEKFAPDFGGLLERSGVGVFAKFSVVDAGAIEAGGCANIGLERSAESEVATDTETHGAEFAGRDFGMRGKPIESGAATGVEIGDGSFESVVETARAAGIVERDGAAGRLDTVVDLRSGRDETVAGETNTGAEHRTCELKDVRVTQDGGEFAFGVWRREERAHR